MIALDDCENALAVRRGDVPPHVVNRDVLERPEFRPKLERLRERWEDEPGEGAR